MCVDWKGVELAPLEDFGSNRKVMLVDFLPCNTQEDSLVPGSENKISEDCNTEDQKLWDYLQRPEFVVLSNSGRFVFDEYDEQRI